MFTDTELLKCFKPNCTYSREALSELIGAVELPPLSAALGRLSGQGYVKKDLDDKTWSLTPKGKAATYFEPVADTVSALNAKVKDISSARSAKDQKQYDPVHNSLKSLEALFKSIKRKPTDISIKRETLTALAQFMDPTISSKLIEIADDLVQLEAITTLGEGMK
ncbi:hypothetical protein [Alteromonas sp. P256]|uniref:hypothetical protein n=1 Tax=Alteromonas sp. P256 TaxID=3117399 RepID=UPI002FE1C9AF